MMDSINVLGKPCPIPVIEARKALRKAPAGEAVRILVDNDISRQNLEKMAGGLGCPSSFEKQEDGNILVTIINTPAAGPAPATSSPGGSGGLVVAIGKNTMGQGSDELGAVLIKAFIYSLTELDTPPETLLFFNSGVNLTTQGSAAIADLQKLESRGTTISSCGTCLDFYGLKEKLAIGTVTNMYAIVTAMGEAGRLINL
ncbi:MAG: sulfurtransferase-like selenium metabolism protein YedF [Spirochaetaceae bacterium]|jgi:selenium metabolism protein YedF|nr:sulfurtransferase-like selenium metabolism protein YedF [Spirochaetaceae bacterium]